MALQPSLKPLIIAGDPNAPHTLDIFRTSLILVMLISPNAYSNNTDSSI